MWCIFHKWGRWMDIQKGDLVGSEKSKTPIGMYFIQERVCAKCNKRERNLIRARF